MDIEGIAAVASGMAQERTANAVSIAMLKKTLDLQGVTVLTLINAASEAPAARNRPPHLGNHIDVTA